MTIARSGVRVVALVCALVLACVSAGYGQVLVVPLTGKRTRDIQTASLFHTLFTDFFLEDDATTYVQTGDIPAMWLRDSSAQTIPYLRFQRSFPILQARFAGVIERDARNIDTDPYANAFRADYGIWERKWEVDSLAWPVILASVYWRNTQDDSIFTPALHRALDLVVSTYRCEQQHRTCSHYRFARPVDSDPNYADGTGLIWGAFRPSDDPVRYHFNIPQNALAAVALRDIVQLARYGFRDATLAGAAQRVGERVETGILRYGIFWNDARRVWMYAYETDGLGHYALMDDANIPDLTSLPYIDWSAATDPIYLNTRSFTLSRSDPYYFSGRYAAGLGSPHTPHGYVWPLGIMGRALTATSSLEVAEAITTLAETDSRDGLIHESFYPNGYWRFTRASFGWGNALYADLLFRSVAGERPTQFAWDGPMLPFQRRSRTPTLVPFFTALLNAAELNATLGRMLNEGPGD